MLIGFLLLLTILSTSVFTVWTIWLTKLILIDHVQELGNFFGILLAVIFCLLSIFAIYAFWKNRKKVTYVDVGCLFIIFIISLWANSMLVWIRFPFISVRNVTFISICKSLNGKEFNVEEMLKLDGWCMYDHCTAEKIDKAMEEVKNLKMDAVYIYTDRATDPHLSCTFTETEPNMQTSMHYYSD